MSISTSLFESHSSLRFWETYIHGARSQNRKQ